MFTAAWEVPDTLCSLRPRQFPVEQFRATVRQQGRQLGFVLEYGWPTLKGSRSRRFLQLPGAPVRISLKLRSHLDFARRAPLLGPRRTCADVNKPVSWEPRPPV